MGGGNYSTDERIVGTWINSKPIYQKTFTGKTGSSIETFVEIGASVETIIEAKGFLYNSSQGRYYQFPQVDAFGSATGYVYLDCYDDNASSANKNKFSVTIINESTHKNMDFYVTLLYTKTIDVVE